ncbi:FAD-binding domain-containing [Fusarium longipes]|uniref:FAD-binding domain-containing n=1 Tax=Fusarium longipes TaxID=694270 RepID=A0A395T7G3_9HYPO|nr:FAD-binding domain-containing [Fusarium longipes]
MPGLVEKTNWNALVELLSQDQVLLPGTEAYAKATFVGNLCYRYTNPAVVVQARSVQDVQSTIAFANKNGVKLTAKSGGHSFMGYCLNEGGIVLDMSQMHGCSIDKDNMMIHMQGGLLWQDVYYKHLQDKRDIVIGGQCASIGVSGFTLGGGISPFSRSYGLACDNLLEMTVVTASGDVITVSKDDQDEKKRDLFWALCGGGGGNFGITVSMTSKMHRLRDPDGKVVSGHLIWNLPQQQEDFDGAMQALNSSKSPAELTIDALWSHGPNKQFTGEMKVVYNGCMEEAQESLKHILVHEPLSNTLKEVEWTDCVEESEGWDAGSKIYHHNASFIFAEGAITPELTSTVSGLVKEAAEVVGITDENNTNQPKCHFAWGHIGAKTEEVSAKDTAFYWRNGHYVATFKTQWTDKKKREDVMSFMAKCQETLSSFAIEQKAAYVNYIDGTVQNWQGAYYGSNHSRLQQIKEEWDPTNFFSHRQSIKSANSDSENGTPFNVLWVPSKKGLLEMLQTQKLENWWEDGMPTINRETCYTHEGLVGVIPC